MLVDLLYYLCYFGEEEEEDFSLLPCVLSSRVCVCVCACKSSSSTFLYLFTWYQSLVWLQSCEKQAGVAEEEV